jgi:hypothetical protein
MSAQGASAAGSSNGRDSGAASRWRSFQRRAYIAPLWMFFVYYLVAFGGLQLLSHRPAQAAIEGLMFAAIMTIVLRRNRRRDIAAAGGHSLADAYETAQSMRLDAAPPTTREGRDALSGMLARRRRQWRFGRIFAPVVFGLMTALSIFNTAMNPGQWFYIPLFAAATAACIWASAHSKNQLDAKEAQLTK